MLDEERKTQLAIKEALRSDAKRLQEANEILSGRLKEAHERLAAIETECVAITRRREQAEAEAMKLQSVAEVSGDAARFHDAVRRQVTKENADAYLQKVRSAMQARPMQLREALDAMNLWVGWLSHGSPRTIAGFGGDVFVSIDDLRRLLEHAVEG